MKTNIKNVLVATDFSQTGNNAVIAAVDICIQNDAVLHLMHVIENLYFSSIAEPGTYTAIALQENDQEARDKLYNIYESVLRDYEVQVQIHMPVGIPSDEICKTAAAMPIDLIVMGSHGVSGVREFFIGSTAFNVIKHTAIAVLTIPDNFESGQFTNILFPVRPVNGILEKYNFVESLLWKGVNIHLALLCTQGQSDQFLGYKKELFQILTSLKKAGIKCSSQIYTCENLAAKVLELSAAINADLVVINTKLDYKWTQYFSGSYTQQVVNHAKLPVLSFHS